MKDTLAMRHNETLELWEVFRGSDKHVIVRAENEFDCVRFIDRMEKEGVYTKEKAA